MKETPRVARAARSGAGAALFLALACGLFPLAGAAQTGLPSPGNPSAGSSPPGSTPPGTLVFHLDGVSARLFEEAFAAGDLEHLRRTFGEGAALRRGITFFPPFTSAVVSRVRETSAADRGTIIDWSGYDRATGATRGQFRIFLEYLGTIPRRGRSAVLYGLPYMDPLAGLAMRNVPELLERYGFVEFYWFGTDTAGHLFGEEALRASLRRFDRAFGRIVDRIPEETSLVVYSDHGMVFADVADYDVEVTALLGDAIEHYGYPNLYLRDPSTAPEVARRLVRETHLDFAFWRAGPDQVEGWSADGPLAFVRDPAGIRYLHDGSDPLGYLPLGYGGAPLDPDAWLALTHAAPFPYTPVRIVELFDNPRVGDVVVALNDPKAKGGPWAVEGNHQGITAADMAVPVLLRGPRLESLAARPAVRLEELLRAVERSEDGARSPGREAHGVRVWAPLAEDRGVELQAELSPAYRTRFGVEGALGGDANVVQAWGSWDLASGYLARIWIGGALLREGRGGDPDASARSRIALVAEYGFRVQDLGFDWRFSTAEGGRIELFYRFGDRYEVRLRNLDALGFGVRF